MARSSPPRSLNLLRKREKTSNSPTRFREAPDNLTPFPLVPIFQTDPEALSPITIRMPANYGFNFPIAAPES
jgi:hypothetical protein